VVSQIDKSEFWRNTLLRISGAIQVLEEELAKESKQESGDLGLSEVIPEPEPITE
jgi:hypothetical protein